MSAAPPAAVRGGGPDSGIGQEAVPTLYQILNSSCLHDERCNTIGVAPIASARCRRNRRWTPCSSCQSRSIGCLPVRILRTNPAHPAHCGPLKRVSAITPLNFTWPSKGSAWRRNDTDIPQLQFPLTARRVRRWADWLVSLNWICRSAGSFPRPGRRGCVSDQRRRPAEWASKPAELLSFYPGVNRRKSTRHTNGSKGLVKRDRSGWLTLFGLNPCL